MSKIHFSRKWCYEYGDFPVKPPPKWRLKRFFRCFWLKIPLKCVLSMVWWRCRYLKVSSGSGLSKKITLFTIECVFILWTMKISNCWPKKSTILLLWNCWFFRSTFVDLCHLKDENAINGNEIYFFWRALIPKILLNTYNVIRACLKLILERF